MSPTEMLNAGMDLGLVDNDLAFLVGTIYIWE